jgi:hypothetical protein
MYHRLNLRIALPILSAAALAASACQDATVAGPIQQGADGFHALRGVAITMLVDLRAGTITSVSISAGRGTLAPSTSIELTTASLADGRSYVMNADGTGQTNLTNKPDNDQGPAWSADGSKIAFTSTRDGNREIYVMNANGTAQANLTVHAASDDEPNWN